MDETQQIQIIENSLIFDPLWYARTNPDVELTDLTPSQHYLRIGARIGRSPSPLFDMAAYMSSHPEISTKDLNPVIHYESRTPTKKYVYLENISTDNFCIKVTGRAVHPEYPGMQVRVKLRIGKEVLASTIATRPDPKGAFGHGNAFHFELTALHVNADQIDNLEIGVRGPNRDYYATLKVPRLTKHSLTAQETNLPNLFKGPGDVIGHVERRTNFAVSGWALANDARDMAVELLLLADGMPLAYTKATNYREDVQRLHGGSGFAGFHFEVPLNFGIVPGRNLQVVPLFGVNRIENWSSALPQYPGIFAQSKIAPSPTCYFPSTVNAPIKHTISIIILNRNGAHLLHEMFASISTEDLTQYIEWIVVDHDSEDTSKDVCQAAQARGARVKFLHRQGNYGFSESNNLGALNATGTILVFANNDLVFKEPFAATLTSLMTDPNIGLLGVQLIDYIESTTAAKLEIPQHSGVFFSKRLSADDWIRPYEARVSSEIPAGEENSRRIAVTGAFLVMQRTDFEKVGMFCEDYYYGLEDIDLCMKVHHFLKKEVVCTTKIKIAHHRGFSRDKDEHSTIRRRKNNYFFNRRWGPWLRSRIKQDVLTGASHALGSRPVLAFICDSVGDISDLGEHLTFVELGRAIQRVLPCHVRYLARDDWYDLAGVDLLIVMVNQFDIRKAINVSPWLVTVNWMHQWFDRWVEDATTGSFDYLIASSNRASEYVANNVQRQVGVVPIGVGEQFFEGDAIPEDKFKSEYCFIGSRFGPPTEIEFLLQPNDVDGAFKAFGRDWSNTPFENWSCGPIPYSQIKQVYASSSIVIDDASIATKDWGSCSSRVFDAIAAGCLLITNDKHGVRELFGELVPTYETRDELHGQLSYWLKHPEERQERAKTLQELVKSHHNYDERARVFIDWLSKAQPRARVSIKCAAKIADKEVWGDFHYANGLAAALRKVGYVVRVDCREDWSCGIASSDDVVIVLRGLLQYKPRVHQINFMWLISHPADVTVAEMAEFDHVFVASDFHTQLLSAQLNAKVSFLPQCTDSVRFSYDSSNDSKLIARNLYVANSRGILRDPVRWSIQHELQIDIFGVGWEPFITDGRHRGQLVPNEILARLYRCSRLVICDHWRDMQDLGYVSNRVFDVLGSGGALLVDRVRGLEDLVPREFCHVYETEVGFVSMMKSGIAISEATRIDATLWVKKYHTFDARAITISMEIDRQLADRPLLKAP